MEHLERDGLDDGSERRGASCRCPWQPGTVSRPTHRQRRRRGAVPAPESWCV